MTDNLPIFSADSQGVITAVGWGDPSNVWPGGTTSQPIEDDSTPDLTGS